MALTLNGTGQLQWVSPVVNTRASVNSVTQVRADSTRIVVSLTLYPSFNTGTIPTTLKVYKLNIAFANPVVIVDSPTDPNTSVSAVIPYPSSGNLMLVYDGTGGSLLNYYQTDGSSMCYEYADNKFITNNNTSFGVTTTRNTVTATEMFPLDMHSPTTNSTIDLTTVPAYSTNTARMTAVQSVMTGLSGAITCTHLANGVLVVAGYLSNTASFAVPRLTGTASQYVIPTAYLGNGPSLSVNSGPFIIVYSVEDGNVITAGRLMESNIAADAITIRPTAVVYSHKSRNIFIAYTTNASSTSITRYANIYNNNVNVNSGNMGTYVMATGVSAGCGFIGTYNLTTGDTQLGGNTIPFYQDATMITSMAITPATKTALIQEVVVAGYTTAAVGWQVGPIYYSNTATGRTAAYTAFYTDSYGSTNTAFMFRLVDGAVSPGYVVEIPPPTLIGGSAAVVPTSIRISPYDGSVSMIGTIGAGTAKMYGSTSDWFPYQPSPSASYISDYTGSGYANAFDGNAGSYWTSGANTFVANTGLFQGGTNTYGGAYLRFMYQSAYGVPAMLSGVRIVSSFAANRPSAIKVMYLNSTTGVLATAYTTAASTSETWVNNVLEVFFAAVSCTDAFLVVTACPASPTSTFVNISELRFMGASPWFPMPARENPGNNRDLWYHKSIVTSSTDCDAPDAFTYQAENSQWYSQNTNMSSNDHTYYTSQYYYGPDSRGGDWLGYNFVAKYGKQRTVGAVRISSPNNPYSPIRFNVIQVLGGIETVVYSSVADEPYSTISGITMPAVTLTLPSPVVCDSMKVVFTKIVGTGAQTYLYVWGIRFFDPTVGAAPYLSYNGTTSSAGFVAKWNADGSPAYFGTPASVTGTNTSSVSGLDIDPGTGNVVVSGQFTGSAFLNNMNDGTLSREAFASAGSTDVFMAEYNLAGVMVKGQRVLSGSLAEQGTQVRVAPTGTIYVSGMFSSTTSTPYNLSDGLQGSVSTLSSASGSLDVFMLTYDRAGACKYAASVLASSTTDSLVMLEVDKHEGYFLCGSVGDGCAAKDHAGNSLGTIGQGSAMLRVHGTQNKNTLQIVPFEATSATSVKFCDVQPYTDSSSGNSYLYALIAMINPAVTCIPNLDGTPSSVKFTRVLASNQQGIYLVKYNAVTSAVIYGDLVTSSPIYMAGMQYQYHSKPRLRVAPSGMVYVLACTVNANFNSGGSPYYNYGAYSVDGSGVLAAYLPVERYSAVTRVLLVQYNSVGQLQNASYVVDQTTNGYGVINYPTALEIDSSNNVYVAFTSNAAFTNNASYACNMCHLNQSGVFATGGNNTGSMNFGAYLMQFNPSGVIQWGRLIAVDSAAYGTGFYTSIQGINFVGSSVYVTGCYAGNCCLRTYSPNATFPGYGTLNNSFTAAQGNSRHYTWMMKLASGTSTILYSGIVLVGRYSSNGWCGVGCTFSDANGNIWIGLTYNPCDMSSRYVPMVFNLTQNADSNGTPVAYYNTQVLGPGNSAYGYSMLDNWNNAIYYQCYAMRLNTNTDTFDLVSRRPLTCVYDSSDSTSRFLGGTVDASGNLIFLLATTGSRSTYLYNFDGTVGCKSPFVDSDGVGPYALLAVKYTPTGQFVSCVNATASATSPSAIASLNSNQVVFGATMSPGLSCSANNTAVQRIVDDGDNLVAPMYQTGIAPLLVWTHNYAAMATAASPVGSLLSYTTWIADTLPTAPTASVGIASGNYALGTYVSATSTVPINNMTKVLSEYALPATGVGACTYVTRFDATNTCTLAAILMKGVVQGSVVATSRLSDTEIAVAAVAAGTSVSLYNFDGLASSTVGPVATSAGAIVVAHFAISSGLCTSAYALVTGGDVGNTIAAIRHNTYEGGYVIAGNTTTSVASAVAPNAALNAIGPTNPTTVALGVGGFVIKVNSAFQIAYAGTVLPGGSLVNVSVGTMGQVSVVGMCSTKVVCPTGISSSFANTIAPLPCGIVLQLAADGSLAGTSGGVLSLGAAIPVGVRHTGEDQIVVAASLSATQTITDMAYGIAVGTWTATVQSTAVLSLTRLNAVLYCNVVSAYSTPKSLAVDTVGDVFVAGTASTALGGTMTAQNASDGAVSAGLSLAPSTASDAFLLQLTGAGVVSNLSRMSTMPCVPVDLRISVVNNAVYVSATTTGNGSIKDAAGATVYTVSDGQARNLWVLMPLNMSPTALSTTIKLNLPAMPYTSLVNNKCILLPKGSFQVNKANRTTASSASDSYSVTSGTSTATYKCVIGDWA